MVWTIYILSSWPCDQQVPYHLPLLTLPLCKNLFSQHFSCLALSRYLFETFKNYVFVFSLKTMHHVYFNKQGLRVAKQSLCKMQMEAHSYKERHPSSSNRASVWTKQGLCVCLKSLLVFFMQCHLNPGYVVLDNGLRSRLVTWMVTFSLFQLLHLSHIV